MLKRGRAARETTTNPCAHRNALYMRYITSKGGRKGEGSFSGVSSLAYGHDAGDPVHRFPDTSLSACPEFSEDSRFSAMGVLADTPRRASPGKITRLDYDDRGRSCNVSARVLSSTQRASPPGGRV